MNTTERDDLASRIEAAFPAGGFSGVAEAIRGASADQCWPEISTATRASTATPAELAQLFHFLSMEESPRPGVFFLWHVFADRPDVLTECWKVMTFQHSILSMAVLVNDEMASYFAGSPDPAPSASLVAVLTRGPGRRKWQSKLDIIVSGLLGIRGSDAAETGEPVPSWVVVPPQS